MKLKTLLFTFLLSTLILISCTNDPDEQPPQTTPPETTPDVVATPSMVDEEAAFEKAISNTGTWIICLLTDLSFDKDLVLDGEFTNGKKDDQGKDIIQRKIALYTQDEDRKVTERFTLTIPKLTIDSPNSRIQSGTFKGDLYISAENFELVDTTVEGNVYFTTEKAQSTYKKDATSTVTGVEEMAQQ